MGENLDSRASMIGLHLSHYAIEAEIGRGGMGIVFQAKDTHLNRTIALKVLPAGALVSEEDRARFRREAQSAAQLNHPNVCHIYQVGEAQPRTPEGKPVEGQVEPRLFIAMEYVAGETLLDLVKKGPVKLLDATNIARQVAEALREAHTNSIVHRDIKSANIMLTEAGVAKVLDFGLAKSDQATMLTRAGSTLGTMAYMSPEQARGQAVDGRSDLYSLGTVIYEMVTGRLPYTGDYEQAVLYSLLNEDPEPLTALRTGVPMQLERIVEKLLKKEAEYRYQSAADLLADLGSLDLAASGKTAGSLTAVAAPSTSRKTAAITTVRRLPTWVWGTMAVLAAVSLLSGWLLRAPTPAAALDLPVVRATLDVLEGPSPPFGLALSRDGKYLGFTDFQTVRIRDLQSGEEWTIPESEGAYGMEFSADGSWLLLLGLNGVERAPFRRGRPVPIVGPSTGHEAVWGPGETVLYHAGGAIQRVPTGGGTPEQILAPDERREQREIREPFVSQDGSTLLVKIEGSDGRSRTGVFDYPSMRERAIIAPGGDRPTYLESGHLVYNVSGVLLGRPFDLATATPLGPPAPIASEITPRAWSASRSGLMASAFQIAFSASGPGSAGLRLVRQHWNEELEVLPVQPGDFDDIDLAADGRRLVVELGDDLDGNYLWMIDLSTGVRNQLTFRGRSGGGEDPVFSPEGDSVLYVDRLGDASLLKVQATDGSGEPRALLERQGERFADPDWSPDRSTIAYATEGEGKDEADIWFLDLLTGTARAGIGGRGVQREPRFSPDGRYLLYDGAQADGDETSIFVQPTDLGGARWDVSRGLGYDARWARDGSAIYFRRNEGLMRVRIETEGGFRILGNPETMIVREGRVGDWALLPDGSGIINVTQELPPDASRPVVDIPIDLVFNWFAEVEEKAPHPQAR